VRAACGYVRQLSDCCGGDELKVKESSTLRRFTRAQNGPSGIQQEKSIGGTAKISSGRYEWLCLECLCPVMPGPDGEKRLTKAKVTS
jgi:hypothetical protein